MNRLGMNFLAATESSSAMQAQISFKSKRAAGDQVSSEPFS
jgi:hypothetical protein